MSKLDELTASASLSNKNRSLSVVEGKSEENKLCLNLMI